MIDEQTLINFSNRRMVTADQFYNKKSNSQMRSSTSPFRGRIYQGSTTPQSLDLLVKSLERENTNLVEEINLLRSKNKKVGELETKIELILKHNNQLLNENERLARLINQKKSQLDLWRGKYEDLATNRNMATDIEIKRLLSQVDKLKEDIVEMEHLKNKQISEVKNQCHLEVQSIKRGGLGSAEKYELEIRKLKEYCEKKDYEVTDASTRLVRISKENQFEINKLRDEKERLKTQLLYESGEHKRQFESLRNKFQYNFHSEVESLKKQHLNQIEAMDYENTKLKEVINAKNNEIEQIWIMNSKVKENYEDSLDLAHRDIEDLKGRIVQIQEISQIELARMRDKMQGIKESELAIMRTGYGYQLDQLNDEAHKIKELLNDKHSEMINLAQERNQMRIQLEAEILRGKSQLQIQVEDNNNLQIRHSQEVSRLDDDYRHKNEEMKNMETHLRQEIDILRDQNHSTNEALNARQSDLDYHRKETESAERVLKAEVASLSEKVTNLKDKAQRLSRKSSSDLEDLKRTYQLKISQLETRMKGQDGDIEQLNGLVRELKQNIENLDREVKLCEEKIDLLQNYEKELRRQATEAEARWDSKQKEFNLLLKDQIRSMDNARKKECEELNSLHENKAKTLRHQIGQLQREIESKNKLMNGLKAKYDDLVNKFEEIFGQKAAQKNLDIKIPGWLPDTIATKSLFDVFIKNKVLEYCS